MTAGGSGDLAIGSLVEVKTKQILRFAQDDNFRRLSTVFQKVQLHRIVTQAAKTVSQIFA